MFSGLLQPTHIAFVLVVALLVFGPRRLPEIARSLGHGLRELKGSLAGLGDDHQDQPLVADEHNTPRDGHESDRAKASRPAPSSET